MSEQLNGDHRMFRAKLKDGSTVVFKAQWQGYADFDWHESGGPATWEHPYDDRQCHWSAAGRIVRSVAVVVADQEYWRDDLTTAFTATQANQGAALQLPGFQGENCNQCADRRESDFGNMRTAVNAALAGTVDADLPKVMASLKASPGVVQLELS